MDLIESRHADVLYINPNEESQIDGINTGVIFKNGYRYDVIDNKIAVKEETVWRKVHKLFIDGLPFLLLAGAALIIASTTLALIGLESMSTLISIMSLEEWLALHLLGSALFISSIAYIRLQGYNPREKLKFGDPKIIAELRAMVDENLFVSSAVEWYAQGNVSHLYSAFTESEAKDLFAKSMEKYTFSELIRRVGFDAAYELAPNDQLLEKFKAEYPEDISYEELEKVKKFIQINASEAEYRLGQGKKGDDRFDQLIQEGLMSEDQDEKESFASACFNFFLKEDEKEEASHILA